MRIKTADKNDLKEAMKIAKSLKEWFNKDGIKNMKTDFELDNVIVAIDDGKVVGFLCYVSDCGKMRLIWMGTKRDMQRKGIGTALLVQLEKESKKFGLRKIEVETIHGEDNYRPYKKTIEFYYKNGFKRISYKNDQIILEKVIR